MRHGRRVLAVSGVSPATKTNSPFPELRNVLLVASLSKTLSQSGTRSLDSESIPISEPIVLQILRRNSIDPSKKLDFFKWCFSLRPSYKHSVSAYSQILRTVCRTGLLGEIPDLLISMKEDEVKLDQSTSKVLLDSLIRSGKFDSALGVLDYLEESGENSPSLYNICIHGFGCYGDLDTVLCLFNEMKKKKNLSPDICTYNSLIHALCLSGKAKDALIVMEELKVSGHEPDNSTYRILIQGCVKSYRFDDAMRIFGEMQYNGFVPDTIVYNLVIDGMLKARKVVEACTLFEKMVQEGVRASSWTYNVLIDGLFKNGRGEAGFTLFCDLKKKGEFVDAVTFSIVVLQLCKEGKLEEAVKLVDEMEDRGFGVDLVTISSLLIGFHKQGRWDWKEKLMKHIRNGNLIPNVLRWNAGVEAVLKRSQSKEKDYTPMFPSNGSFLDIVNTVSPKEEEEVTAIEDDDPWSSSPYMDRLAQNRGLSKPLFGLNRGQRV